MTFVLWNFDYNFNPRLREGGDFHGSSHILNGNNFNPRLREGGDQVLQ